MRNSAAREQVTNDRWKNKLPPGRSIVFMPIFRFLMVSDATPVGRGVNNSSLATFLKQSETRYLVSSNQMTREK